MRNSEEKVHVEEDHSPSLALVFESIEKRGGKKKDGRVLAHERVNV